VVDVILVGFEERKMVMDTDHDDADGIKDRHNQEGERNNESIDVEGHYMRIVRGKLHEQETEDET
jgi:hypothetical protein